MREDFEDKWREMIIELVKQIIGIISDEEAGELADRILPQILDAGNKIWFEDVYRYEGNKDG